MTLMEKEPPLCQNDSIVQRPLPYSIRTSLTPIFLLNHNKTSCPSYAPSSALQGMDSLSPDLLCMYVYRYGAYGLLFSLITAPTILQSIRLPISYLALQSGNMYCVVFFPPCLHLVKPLSLWTGPRHLPYSVFSSECLIVQVNSNP